VKNSTELINFELFHHPMMMVFINSIVDLALIFFIPTILFVFYVALNILSESINFNDDNAALSIVLKISFFIITILGAIYFYYVFFILDYLLLFLDSLKSLIIAIFFIIISPFILIFNVLKSSSSHDLFINTHLLQEDIRLWAEIKFKISIDEHIKELFIVFFKLLSLFLFSFKIVNITQFIITGFFNSNSKMPKFFAYTLLIGVGVVYFINNTEELYKIYEISINLYKTFLSGEMA